MESDVPDDDDKAPLNMSRDSEQREIDEFEEEERRLLAEEEKVNKLDSRLWKVFLFLLTFTTRENQSIPIFRPCLSSISSGGYFTTKHN